MKSQIKKALTQYQKLCSIHPIFSSFSDQKNVIERFESFIDTHPSIFFRSDFPGHITGSAILVSKERNKVLLTKHAKLNKWLLLGGHADGNSNIFKAALREAEEESGLFTIHSPFSTPIDLDIHTFPKTDKEPEHLHYDVRYLFFTEDDTILLSEESLDLKWVRFEEVGHYTEEPSVLRPVQKAQKILQG